VPCPVNIPFIMSIDLQKIDVEHSYSIEADEFLTAQFMYSTDILLRRTDFWLHSCIVQVFYWGLRTFDWTVDV
jgi:hypothetical protein